MPERGLRSATEMSRERSNTGGLNSCVAAGSLLVLLGLALPFIPFPGDRVTRIAIQFRNTAKDEPTRFTARTSASICTVLAATMAYDNPQSGGYAHIDCGRVRSRAANDAVKL